VGQTIKVGWEYEFFDVDPTDIYVPLTPQKIVTAIFLFVLGIVLARVTRRFLGKRVFPRFHLEQGASAAYQKLVFYFLVFMFFLLALRALQVPLTAFTVLGGALAIGVGFGSQNLLNNFISGLIMLAERPIRIGDLIEVENTYGIVEQIGARSTRVLTSDNITIVIPNSSFLENNVVNWTLSNDVMRTKVTVGVAYGSPTREVDRLMRYAVTEHGRVLKAPEPIVIFEDFGDNSLVFEIYFWLRARTVMARRRVQSDIRFRIDNLFREAGIAIAFPQHDVHVDSASPLDVRLLPADDPPPRASSTAPDSRPG
jgi:small-conductance mechanosensitive channel